MYKHSLIILLFSLTIQAQKNNTFALVSDSIKSQNFEKIQMIKNERKYRGKNTLSFECGNNSQLEYSDNESDQDYVRFEELGQIKNSITVILKTDYNSEQYILLETKNCKELKLEGLPLRIEKTENYVVLNNPGTDEKYKIQILEYKDDFFSIKNTVIFPSEIIPKKVIRIEKNKIYILDSENKIWETKL